MPGGVAKADVGADDGRDPGGQNRAKVESIQRAKRDGRSLAATSLQGEAGLLFDILPPRNLEIAAFPTMALEGSA